MMQVSVRQFLSRNSVFMVSYMNVDVDMDVNVNVDGNPGRMGTPSNCLYCLAFHVCDRPPTSAFTSTFTSQVRWLRPDNETSFAAVFHCARRAPKRMTIGFADTQLGEGRV